MEEPAAGGQGPERRRAGSSRAPHCGAPRPAASGRQQGGPPARRQVERLQATAASARPRLFVLPAQPMLLGRRAAGAGRRVRLRPAPPAGAPASSRQGAAARPPPGAGRRR